MNKELIKKYKAEFNHWLNGGKLLYCSNSSTIWYAVIGDNVWSINSSGLKIVIDDGYTQFRIALSEGKTVEVLHYTGYKEFDQNPWKLFAIGVSTFDKPVENYRIKSEEPQFKVGDWVRDSRDSNLNQVINPNSPAALSDYIKWKPQPGELVVIKNKNDIISIIKYNGETNVYPFIGEITWLHKKD